MSDHDIMELLESPCEWTDYSCECICGMARDEIERLTNLLEYARNEIKDGRKEIERLTADNEMLRDELEQQYARVEELEELAFYDQQTIDLMKLNAKGAEGVAALAVTEQVDPDHEAENSMCACPTCINEGWAEQE